MGCGCVAQTLKPFNYFNIYFFRKINNILLIKLLIFHNFTQMFSLHLPHCSLVELFDIFISIATITDDYFVCNSQIRETAMLIDHIPLSLRVYYKIKKINLNLFRIVGFSQFARSVPAIIHF